MAVCARGFQDAVVALQLNADALIDAEVHAAAKLCNASMANIRMHNGDVLRPLAFVGASEELKEFLLENPIEPGREHIAGRAFLTGELVHVTDVLSDPEYGDRAAAATAQAASTRTGSSRPAGGHGDSRADHQERSS